MKWPTSIRLYAVLTSLFIFSSILHAREDYGSNLTAMPDRELFGKLIADPKQPRFAASYQWAEQTSRRFDIGAVSLGESFGLLRWARPWSDQALQLNFQGAVFAQFDMQAPMTDLMNTDFTAGAALDYRHRRSSARLLIYHQSSHLGDEYIQNNQPSWINLNFESAELLLAQDIHSLRIYGGGEYLFHRKPEGIGRGLAHAGLEWRPEALLRGWVGQAGGRFIAGADVKAWQETGWSAAVSVKAGVEFSPADQHGQHTLRRSLLAEFYHGFNPYGQFFAEKVSYLGLGVEFRL